MNSLDLLVLYVIYKFCFNCWLLSFNKTSSQPVQVTCTSLEY